VAKRRSPLPGRVAPIPGAKLPLFTTHRTDYRAIESIHDITEHKQIEEDLKRSREKYHNIFENSIMALPEPPERQVHKC